MSNLFPGQALEQEQSLLQLLGRKGWAHWGFEIKQTACLADSYFFMDWSAGGIVEAGWLLVCCIHVSEKGKSWLGYPFSIVVVAGILNLS